ncbi:MAG TPA: Ig-like domain-containing protein, partial [Flavisolibacter sp.]|nr:Ig-like domain-containing protein [Flavisolibacter sp.]
MKTLYALCVAALCLHAGCSKKDAGGGSVTPTPTLKNFSLSSWTVNNVPAQATNVNPVATVRLQFDARVDRASVGGGIVFTEVGGGAVPFGVGYTNNDSLLLLTPSAPLAALKKYTISIGTGLRSTAGGRLQNAAEITF